MDKTKTFVERIKEDYYFTLQSAHEARGFDKDYVLYERIIALNHFINGNDTDALIHMIEEWIIEKRSLIVYFCSPELINKSLEGIVVSDTAKDIGIDSFVVKIAKERLKQIEIGMNDENVVG